MRLRNAAQRSLGRQKGRSSHMPVLLQTRQGVAIVSACPLTSTRYSCCASAGHSASCGRHLSVSLCDSCRVAPGRAGGHQHAGRPTQKCPDMPAAPPPTGFQAATGSCKPTCLVLGVLHLRMLDEVAAQWAAKGAGQVVAAGKAMAATPSDAMPAALLGPEVPTQGPELTSTGWWWRTWGSR